MSIFSSPTPAQALHDSFLTWARYQRNGLISGTTKFFNQIWNNIDQVNLSPPQAWAALGTNAVQARHAFTAIVTFLNGVVANSIALKEPSNYTVVENQDGSITCTLNS